MSPGRTGVGSTEPAKEWRRRLCRRRSGIRVSARCGFGSGDELRVDLVDEARDDRGVELGACTAAKLR
jgi:hypothetical protein